MGGELFRLGPRFGGGYDSRRGGVRLYTDKAGETEDQQMLAEFPLVDDNDDDDRYADDNLRDYPDGGETESGSSPAWTRTTTTSPTTTRTPTAPPTTRSRFCSTTRIRRSSSTGST